MKTSIFAFVFIAAVAVFVFPPVVGPDDTDSPEIIIRSSDETGSDNPRWIASGVLYNTDDESDDNVPTGGCTVEDMNESAQTTLIDNEEFNDNQEQKFLYA